MRARHWLAASALVALACAAHPDAPPDTLALLWRDYRALPEHRALAIAGDLRRTSWVAGSSGGQPTRALAEQAALRECAARRLRARAQAACRLYAVGDEIVWQAPP